MISCSVDFGSSGAPVLVFDGETPRVVSVVSAKAEAYGRPVSLGTDLLDPLQTLLELVRTDPVHVPRTTTLSKSRAGTGAKFLRP